jgi:hypothetical protein
MCIPFRIEYREEAGFYQASFLPREVLISINTTPAG